MKDTVSHYVPPHSPLTSTEPQVFSNNLTMPVQVPTPQLSSVHCRLTRGRTLVRSQSGPPTVYLRQHPNGRTVLSSWIFLVSGFCPVGRALFSCTNTSMRPNRRTVALTADAGRLVMDNRDARAVRALTPYLAATAPTSQPMKYPQRSPDSPIRESTARPAPSGGPEFALRSTARWGPNWSPAQ